LQTSFIGGVAVLVTLIYLAMQIKAGSKTFNLASFGFFQHL